MGIYFLENCDEQYTEALWNAWLQDEHNTSYLATVEIGTIQDGEDTWLLVEFETKPKARFFAVAAMTAGLLLAETLTFFGPSFMSWVAIMNNAFIKTVFIVCYALLTIGIIVGSLLLTLWRIESFCRSEESSLRDFFLDSSIQLHNYIPLNHWVLFYGDTLIIASCVSILLSIQLIVQSSLFGIFALFPPLLLVLIFILPLLLAIFRAYAFQKIKAWGKSTSFSQLSSCWKLQVTQNILFACFIRFAWPIIFYILLSLFGHGILAIVYLSQFHYFSFNDLILLDSKNIYDIHAIIIRISSFQSGRASLVICIEFVLILFLLLLYFWSVSTFSPFQSEPGRQTEFDPHVIPQHLVQKSAPLAVSGLIFSEWLSLLLGTSISVIIVVSGLMSVCHIHLVWMPLWLVTPFIWFQAISQSILGNAVGDLVTRFVWILVSMPVLFWFLMWLYSLLGACWRSCTYIFLRKKAPYNIQLVLDDLCNNYVHIAPPIVIFDNNTTSWPVMMPLLPFSRFCVIRLSAIFIQGLSLDQLRLILAHELAHVLRHKTRLWWAQLLSRLSFVGSGYLTLLLNYGNMELEADEFAVSLTQDHEGFQRLLEDLKRIEALAMVEFPKKEKKEVQIQPKSLWEYAMKNSVFLRLKNTYTLYFGEPVWSALHPSGPVRKTSLYPDKNERFQDFTESAMEIIQFAIKESRKYQHGAVLSIHLFLGLLCDPITRHILHLFAVDISQAEKDARNFLNATKENFSIYAEMGFAPDSDLIIDYAIEIAHKTDSYFIGSEHLLLGFMHHKEVYDLLTQNCILVEQEQIIASHGGRTDVTQSADRAIADAFAHLSPEQCTEKMKQVVIYAKQEAERGNHGFIAPEHLLLGLLQVDFPVAVLRNLGVVPETIRAIIEFLASYSDPRMREKITFTDRAKKAIKFAVQEAGLWGENVVDTQHLLLGLVCGGKGIAAGILEGIFHITLEQLRIHIGIMQHQLPSTQNATKVFFPPIPLENTGNRFHIFTWQAKIVMEYAYSEARLFRHPYIRPEHVLLGLLLAHGKPAKILEDLGATLDKVRSAVVVIDGRGDCSILGKMDLTPRARQVIRLAYEEARLLGENAINPEHLLLSLTQNGGVTTTGILESLHITLGDLRKQTLAARGNSEKS